VEALGELDAIVALAATTVFLLADILQPARARSARTSRRDDP
jgi:hypothetical protein